MQDVDHSREELKATPPILINGEVNGTKVRDILVDTGTNTTIVSKSLVSEEELMGEEAHVSIQCVHGDIVKYPLARVMVRLAGKSYSIVAAVSESLPVSVLLGRDVPVLAKLLQKAQLFCDSYTERPPPMCCKALQYVHVRCGQE